MAFPSLLHDRVPIISTVNHDKAEEPYIYVVYVQAESDQSAVAILEVGDPLQSAESPSKQNVWGSVNFSHTTK
jgi:hypothetical protein